MQSSLLAQTTGYDPHEIADSIKEGLVEAINSKKIDNISDFLNPNCLIVLENGQVFHSRDDFIHFLSSSSLLDKFKVSKFAIEKVVIDGDFNKIDKNLFIANGTAVFIYHLVRGKTLQVPVHWTASISQVQGKWLLTSYQGTVNVLENPIMDQMRNDFYMICFITLILGFVIGVTWKKVFRKLK